ncbi:MAG: hypothetical protein KA978_32075, partial [Deltaproteobacteria bacterium]|nr:hypothetical protein [Deltaproteobacteria bacterium]
VAQSWLGQYINQTQAANFVNAILNTFINSVFSDLLMPITTSIFNAIDPSMNARYANFTKKYNSIDENFHFRIVLGKGDKPQCYSHENHWRFNGNGGVSLTGDQNVGYSYEMRAGAFYARARVGANWYAIRLIRQ